MCVIWATRVGFGIGSGIYANPCKGFAVSHWLPRLQAKNRVLRRFEERVFLSVPPGRCRAPGISRVCRGVARCFDQPSGSRRPAIAVWLAAVWPS